ncbi:MAG TPA: protein kinase [Kofleriaceae bacterium]|nr:protein kinase [Kofleriaceae bacterium]
MAAISRGSTLWSLRNNVPSRSSASNRYVIETLDCSSPRANECRGGIPSRRLRCGRDRSRDRRRAADPDDDRASSPRILRGPRMSEPRDPARAATEAAPEPRPDTHDAPADLAPVAAPHPALTDSTAFAAGSNPSPPAASRPARDPHARSASGGAASPRTSATAHADQGRAETARTTDAADVAVHDDGPEPHTFGRYRLESVLGTGGMGVVHRAWDPQLERPVAIKVVRSAARDGSRQRLVREAQSLARLSHDNICRVFDVGTQDDEVWVVMELIDGCSLRDRARQHPDPDELLAVLLDAGEGLAAAHAAGVIHRDVKPENVLVTRDGRAIVTDFGLARVELTLDPIASTVTLDHSARLAGEDPHRTATGAIAGTPAYLSPEQLTGAELDARVDQFAWAVMAWELLTGMRPFPIHASARLEAIRNGLTPPTALPRPIGAALVRALSIAPRDRFPSMRELLDTLQPFQPARRSDARSPRSRTARASTAPVTPSRDRTTTAAARTLSARARLARSPVLVIAVAALASAALTIAIWQLTRTRVRPPDSPRAAALSGSAAGSVTTAGSPAGSSSAGRATANVTTAGSPAASSSGATGNVTTGAAGNLTTGAAGNVTTGPTGNVTTGAAGNVTTGAAGNVTTGAAGNVTTGAAGNVTTDAAGNVTTGAAGNVTTGAAGNVTTAGAANTGRVTGNVTTAGAANAGRGTGNVTAAGAASTGRGTGDVTTAGANAGRATGNVTAAGSADTGRPTGNVTAAGSANTGRATGNVTAAGSADTGRGTGNVTAAGSADTGRGTGNVTAAGSGESDAATKGGTGDRTAAGSGDGAIETTPKTGGVGTGGATTTHAVGTSGDSGGGDGGGGDADANARKLPPYKRGNALAMLEGFCRIPIDAAKPDPKLGKPVVDWGTVVRREIVKATIGGREQTMLLYEVKGQRGTYRFSGDTWWDTVGVLDVAPGGMVALCQDAILDMYKLPDPWKGPLGRMEAVLPISRAPRTNELAKLDPVHVSDIALRRDGDAGRLTLPEGRRLLVRAKVEAADGKRWDMSRWWLEVPSGVPGAKLVAPGKRLWFVLEDPKLEEQPDGSKARLVVRAAAVVDDLFP